MPDYVLQNKVAYLSQAAESVSVDDKQVITGRLGTTHVNPSDWPELPHVAFVNLPDTPSAAVAFTEQYGPLFPATLRPGSDWKTFDGNGVLKSQVTAASVEILSKLGWTVEGDFRFDYQDFLSAKYQLQQAWRGDRSQVALLWHEINATDFQVSAGELRTRFLLDYLKLLFLIDHGRGRPHICGNSRCAKPYFLQQRVDQECCSHSCSVQRNNDRAARKRAKKRVKPTGKEID